MSDLPPTPRSATTTSPIAAEFVLGLLEPAELAAFEERLAVDPGFRAPGRAPGARTSPACSTGVPAEAPPPRVEAALMRRLFPEERQSLWRRLGVAAGARWAASSRRSSCSGSPTSASCAAARRPGLCGDRGGRGRLAGGAGRGFEPGAAAHRRRADGRARPPPGRVARAVADPRGRRPGLARRPARRGRGAARGARGAARAAWPGGVLAITDEPPGGSPTGAPTGAVAGHRPRHDGRSARHAPKLPGAAPRRVFGVAGPAGRCRPRPGGAAPGATVPGAPPVAPRPGPWSAGVTRRGSCGCP